MTNSTWFSRSIKGSTWSTSTTRRAARVVVERATAKYDEDQGAGAGAGDAAKYAEVQRTRAAAMHDNVVAKDDD